MWIHKQNGLLQSQLIISIDHNGFYFCPDSTSSHVCSLFLLLSLQQNAKLLHERMVRELSKMKRKHCLCFKIHINKKMKNENKKKIPRTECVAYLLHCHFKNRYFSRFNICKCNMLKHPGFNPLANTFAFCFHCINTMFTRIDFSGKWKFA